MEILNKELQTKFSKPEEIKDVKQKEHYIIQTEEMIKVIEVYFKKLQNIKINNIPLVSKVFNNDTIIIDNNLNIDIINQALKINEKDMFAFLYNIYFFNQDTILKEAIGDYLFIQIPPISFLQTSENRFQLDF